MRSCSVLAPQYTLFNLECGGNALHIDQAFLQRSEACRLQNDNIFRVDAC